MYTPHPSAALNELFAKKPWQGAAPDEATFLFVGLDANYAADIEQSPIFPRIREYHEDGVAFWQKHGVHHPFLLSQYSGAGKLYHRNFARIGFERRHAHKASFIELLHLPTTGSDLKSADLSPAHMSLLDEVILKGAAKHIFLPAGVARLMRATGVFPWLAETAIAHEGPLGVLHFRAGKNIYSHLHFSYRYDNSRKALEAAAIRQFVLRDG